MNPETLIITLAERFGLIVAGAFLLLTITPIHKIGFRKTSPKATIATQILIFGVFGILGTYGGNFVFQSVANLRAMAVITGGLFGGPLVGLGAGLIAGGHRILIDFGGFSAVPCGLATVLEGTAAGLISLKLANRMDWRAAAGLAFVGEIIHMIMVLYLSSPYSEALKLVELIALPMIILNTFGAAIFAQVINIVFRYGTKRDSIQAQQILDIANLTVGHLRSGLTMESAMETAKIIFFNVSVAAVAITDNKNVLAHIGVGDDHHLPGKKIRTASTLNALAQGEPVFLDSSEKIGCNHRGCPFTSAAVVPLHKKGEILGTLKLYGTKKKELDLLSFEIAKGLANLCSTQLELEEIQIKEQMLAHAEIRRLQAQINPHFLFNSLNTVTSFCRTNPNRARELLLELSSYMRKNLDSSRGYIPLSEELDQLKSYLAIEQARFGDRIKVDITVEKECEDWPIPPLIIQPLVENSVKHGIMGREEGGQITISIQCDRRQLSVSIKDDGVGMSQTKLDQLVEKKKIESCAEGIGVRNCIQRIEQIYGPQCKITITSKLNEGTCVSFKIPKLRNQLRKTDFQTTIS
ncbi:LytS/YhcK type 5TM receptor domain-containing protein [Maridesulfovibrio ferrireducens]|uniref:LytS/YhcK type 5TM receptor domain-containing protein n=1 Tax=Maridesulfovibrio ferrireducens TaxID=246191 RepID=UPI001A1A2B55|nr:LytS/YhcK type 5TM receptor domain-containing protein [Maridesulfovibrio ferrireducens]MBI9113121.1 histidine kinase [Maridesulfovibrio ferrireducens]